jgi:uncharacterized protein (TIGR00251 family)
VIKFIEKNRTIVFKVCVVPRASRSEIVGEHFGALKVRLTSPPVDGAANAELIKLLAKRFNVSKSAIEITSGQTSKTKEIGLSGVTASGFDLVLNAKT